MQKQHLVTVALAISLMIAGSSLAFDCSSSETINCNGPTLAGTIGIGPEISFPQCGTTTNYIHKIYDLTLATAQDISVTVAGAAAPFVQIVVFENCDENACLAQTEPGVTTLDGLCLPAGEYTIALFYLIEAVMDFELSMTCTPCEPVPVEIPSFGAIKSYYR